MKKLHIYWSKKYHDSVIEILIYKDEKIIYGVACGLIKIVNRKELEVL